MALTCPSCSAENSEGKRFCGDCGQPLGLECPSCGAEVEPGKRFCGDCGAPVTGAAPAAAPSAPTPEPSRRVAERRLTTVLFGDLVGFTTISESRDPEDVRELLSQYFAMASTVVGRYGGTVEKFIGDAVMAVWGVPVAHEDDAERAVRAGLDLVAEIAVLAAKVGVEGLDMRVGILTGEVAVTLGAVGEGMVAGDAVNTAARIQSAAEPGQVWVDDTTRSMTSAAVTYTDAGEHTMKGKAEPVHLFAAGTIVAAVGGAQRVDGLEAPFTGRDHELRMVKELFHAAIDDGRPRLVAVSGLAGVGKTRLGWEFEKYVDGITDDVYWHRGRVLSYGDGVSFFAVAEMVRARLGVADGDSTSTVEGKLTAGLELFVPVATEREWLRPRLAALLGLGPAPEAGGGTFARDELFAAWATFFERVGADGQCVVLLVDDMQYADPDLLDFFDHLLDTARSSVFLLTLARPDLLDARPGWGAGRRATTLHLEALDERVMTEIVDGLVQGLPEQARAALVARSEGLPLYALEMVRALIDRDAVIPRDGRYVLAPDADQRVDLATLDAPPSLQALIAARLDALTPAERQVVQDATVHGLAFSRYGLGAVSDVADLDEVLDQLVRKEILELHSDRFSPERGQYRFVQALVRTVAYETLSRRDRKARHLAVAAYLAGTDASDEFAAVIARHYLDAVDNGPGDADARELTATALDHFERAAQRALALGSVDEAWRHYTTALARDPEPTDRARLLEGAARAAEASSRPDEAIQHATEARLAYESLGRPVDAARAVAHLGLLLIDQAQCQAAVDLMVPVYDRHAGLVGPADADADVGQAVMDLATALGRAHSILGDAASFTVFNARAMELAEARQDWERMVHLFSQLSVNWLVTSRPVGAIAMLRAAIELGRRHGVPGATSVPLLNLGAWLKNRELADALVAGREAIELAAQTGVSQHVRYASVNLALACWVSGDWDEVEALHADYHEYFAKFPIEIALFRSVVMLVRAARGEDVDFEVVIPEYEAGTAQGESAATFIEAIVTAADGDVAGAVDASVRAVDAVHRDSGLEDDFAVVWPIGVEGALAGGEVAEAERMVRYAADAPSGLVNPLVHAHLLRLRALVGMAGGGVDDADIDADLEQATVELRDFGAPYYVARTLLERAARAATRGDDEAAASLRAEAEEIFVSLKADHWVAAAQSVGSVGAGGSRR